MAILKENGWLIARPAVDNRAAVARLAATMQAIRKHKVHMPPLKLAA